MSPSPRDETAQTELTAMLNCGKDGAATFDVIAKFYTEQFKYSASQRISTLQYFVPAFAFLTAGYVQLLTAKGESEIPPLARIMVATVAYVITLVFARLDRRNKEIVEFDEHPLEVLQTAIRKRLNGADLWESFARRTSLSRQITTYGTLIPIVYLVCASAAVTGIVFPLIDYNLARSKVALVSVALTALLLVAIYAKLDLRHPSPNSAP